MPYRWLQEQGLQAVGTRDADCAEVARLKRVYAHLLVEDEPVFISPNTLHAATARINANSEEVLAAGAGKEASRASETRKRGKRRLRGGPT